jgi:hypothetical protein
MKSSSLLFLLGALTTPVASQTSGLLPPGPSEAPTPIVGWMEVVVNPGRYEPIAPLFLPPPSASAALTQVLDSGALRFGFSGLLPDPIETGSWYKGGIGPYFGEQEVDSNFWGLSSSPSGTKLTKEALELTLGPLRPVVWPFRPSVLGPTVFQLIPFPTVEDLVGDPSVDSTILSGLTPSMSDELLLGSARLWAGSADGTRRWLDSNGSAAQGFVIPDDNNPVIYKRPIATGLAPRRIFLSGTVR